MQPPAATSSRATTLAILALAGATLDTRLRYGNCKVAALLQP